MPITTHGTGVATSLLPDPFAYQLACAAQFGGFDLDDSADNRIDPRCLLADPKGNDGDTDFGFNLIILNSLTRPLKLVDSQSTTVDGGPDFIPVPGSTKPKEATSQICYPAGSVDGQLRNHEIPAARYYPNSKLHLRPNGSPAMVAGLGWYRFDLAHSAPDVTFRALSFQVGDDGTHHLGFIIRLGLISRGPFYHHASFAIADVTADLEREHGNLDNFFNNPIQDYHHTAWGQPHSSTSAADRGSLMAYIAPIGHAIDRLGTNTVVAWVRDTSSTVGLAP